VWQNDPLHTRLKLVSVLAATFATRTHPNKLKLHLADREADPYARNARKITQTFEDYLSKVIASESLVPCIVTARQVGRRLKLLQTSIAGPYCAPVSVQPRALYVACVPPIPRPPGQTMPVDCWRWT
jgi:hypothetical protein